jgi:hypothetical protein
MGEGKKKIFWWLAFALFFFVLTAISGFAIKVYRDYQNIPVNHRIGNRVSNVEALKEKGFPFSFLVIGDMHGRGGAETLVKKALKEGDSSFMVLLGDFVSTPDIWFHRFFMSEMTQDIQIPIPVFLAPGNHDIDYFASKIKADRRVTPEVFESLYGARNFDFVFNQCLFIVCGIDLKNRNSYLDYLRNTLSSRAAGKKQIFVFIHYPPGGLAGYISGPLPMGDQFLSLLESYKVSAAFFGDFHGYWRGRWKGVDLIVSGGGGRHKLSQPEWGKFHHILRITVDHDKISQEILTLPGQFSFLESFKKWLFNHFFPLIKKRGWAPYCLFFLFLSSGIYSLGFFVRSLKKEPEKPPV